ncbi:hypothetical protein [Shewanella xiamenensis]|uniref:hypothetical protein n=1 Tax=Shewanella xiamenensis TaxID=332186 RepID=UPI001186683A|nr:hypothetical protein [Shewanella xiamenensis]
MTKKIKIISFLLLSIYALLPFINGLGCNGTYKSRNHEIEYLSSCRMGIVKTYVWNQKNGQKKIYTSLLAKKGSNLIFFVINSQELDKPASDFALYNISVLRDAPFIWSGIIEHRKTNDITLVGAPSYLIYETDISGKLGFW